MHRSKIKTINICIEVLFYLIILVPMMHVGGRGQWSGTGMHFAVTLLFGLYALKSFIHGRVIFFNTVFNLAAVFFFLSLVSSVVFSVYLNDSLASLVLFFDALIIFYVSMSEDRGRGQLERVVFVLIGAAVLHVGYAFYKPLVVLTEGKGGLFLKGFFYNNNHFAAYIELVFFLPILMLLMKEDMAQWKKYFLWGASLLLSLAMIFSLSRGGLVALILTLLVLSLYKFKGAKRALAAGALFFCPQYYGREPTFY